jgi:DNA-binding beta-propeller fold protein YncE
MTRAYGTAGASRAARILAVAAFAAAGTLLTAHAALADGAFFGTHFGRFDLGGLVYAMTNSSDGNEIVTYLRDRHGRLTPLRNGAVSTGGLGGSANAAIDPLGSQGALVYDDESHMLFAVNAGDNTVAALDANGFGFRPALRTVAPSGGFIPVSLAVSEDRLYVLNAGGSGSVTQVRRAVRSPRRRRRGRRRSRSASPGTGSCSWPRRARARYRHSIRRRARAR